MDVYTTRGLVLATRMAGFVASRGQHDLLLVTAAEGFASCWGRRLDAKTIDIFFVSCDSLSVKQTMRCICCKVVREIFVLHRSLAQARLFVFREPAPGRRL